MSPSKRTRSHLSRASEARLRRLQGGGGERPIRPQAVLGFLVALALLSLPLYLLRRPRAAPPQGVSASIQPVFGRALSEVADAGATSPRVELGPVQRVRCGPSASETSAEGGLCDPLPLLEAGLREAISSTVGCAPRGEAQVTLNYVLEVDFTSFRLNVFAGRSGDVRGPRAKKAVGCVLRAMPPLAWTDVVHRHQYYAIAILATYPAAPVLEVLPRFD